MVHCIYGGLTDYIFFFKIFISFSADLDEMSHHVAFHLGLHCLSSEVPVLWFLVKKKHAKFSNIFLVCLICPICFCKQLMLVLSLCSTNNNIESSSPPPHGE